VLFALVVPAIVGIATGLAETPPTDEAPPSSVQSPIRLPGPIPGDDADQTDDGTTERYFPDWDSDPYRPDRYRPDRYRPDRYRPSRRDDYPTQYDVIYADTIVLRGRDATIVLDVSGRSRELGGKPGILLRNERTRQSAMMYLSSNTGQPVIGISDPHDRNLPAALYASRVGGILQLRQRTGTHVLTANEIVNAGCASPWQDR